MYQIKIFTGQKPSDVESEINNWLKVNHSAVQSPQLQYAEWHSGDIGGAYTIAILYQKPKSKKPLS